MALSTRVAAVATLSLGLSGYALAAPPGFTEHFATVNGTRLHYFIGGKGSPVVLLHGYAQTSYMWNPLMPLLAKNKPCGHRSPPSRCGRFMKPESGYDKKNMAVDVHELVTFAGI